MPGDPDTTVYYGGTAGGGMSAPELRIPEQISGTLKNFGITRIGQKMFGLPVTPRASRGFRRHTRRIKALKNV